MSATSGTLAAKQAATEVAAAEEGPRCMATRFSIFSELAASQLELVDRIWKVDLDEFDQGEFDLDEFGRLIRTSVVV